jgi:L-ascorbate metabolism protein UlaG (beta-lactamase superfamily)
MTVHYDDLELEWLGYATLRVATDDFVAYLDPGRYGVLTGDWTPDTTDSVVPADSTDRSDSTDGLHPPARDYRAADGDLVCVTHDHHYDTDAIRRVVDPAGTVVVFDGVDTHRIRRTVDRPVDLDVETRRVGQEADFAIGDAIVRTVPAYNTPDGHTDANGTPHHPEGRGCGFLVTLADTTVFWPGDTDVLDGHAALDVDVFCPPIGGEYTMNRRDAADLAARLDPGLVVPIHYDTFDAIQTDATAFASDLESRGVDVALDAN